MMSARLGYEIWRGGKYESDRLTSDRKWNVG